MLNKTQITLDEFIKAYQNMSNIDHEYPCYKCLGSGTKYPCIFGIENCPECDGCGYLNKESYITQYNKEIINVKD